MDKSKEKFNSSQTTEVISTVSHQLKSPLSIIKGYVDVLLSEQVGSINSKQREYLEDTLANVERMKELVKKLLDVSRIEESSLDLEPKPSDLEKIIKESKEEFAHLAEAKNSEIAFEVSGEISRLNFDPLRIKQVIDNLISNALDYTKKKGEVSLKLKREGDEVIFCCSDNGVGISEEEGDKIFKKFYRGKEASVMASEGAGLGLFISKNVIEASGGKIWFDSEEGEGTTFCFSLPVED